MCGLKYIFTIILLKSISSHLVRGVWIEMLGVDVDEEYITVAPRERCVD